MKLIYIAGPLRGKTAWEREKNIRNAEEITIELYRAGYAPICPHSMTRMIHGAIDEQVCMDADLEVIKRCDVMLLCGDWESSEGTKVEIEWAKKHNVPTFCSISDLINWKGKSCMNCRHAMKKEKEHPCVACGRLRIEWSPKP